jgi:hypothetical protein
MKEYEYFLPQLNGWLPLSLEAYLALLFPREEPKFSKIKIPKGLSLSPKVSQSQNIAESMLLAGNFIEVKINQNLFLETNQRNGRIEFIQNSEKNSYSIPYDIWYKAKIISYDNNSKLLFVEINDNIEIIDNLDLIRPLKEIKYIKNDLLAFNIKQVQKNEFDLLKNELDKIFNNNNNEDKEKEELYEITYDIKNLSLSLIGNKDILKNISLLKQYEQRYKKNIYDEPNTNSDFSNPNSNNNLIGIKSPSGRSETSEKNNSNKNIILEKDLKEEINNYKYKQSFTYRAKFKKDIEKVAEKLFQNCRYSIGKNYDNNFDITIYGNDEDEFNEEKNTFEKQYKQEMIDCDTTIDMNEIKDLADKSKVKFINLEKRCLYLVGEEKNINNFKMVWNIKKEYSKEIQKESKEKDEIIKEIQSVKKKHKIKK